MQKIEVMIQPDGATAKQINPYKEELDKEYSKGHNASFNLLESFRAFEAMPMTFQIESIRRFPLTYIKNSFPHVIRIMSSEKHFAEILPNGKVHIL